MAGEDRIAQLQSRIESWRQCVDGGFDDAHLGLVAAEPLPVPVVPIPPQQASIADETQQLEQVEELRRAVQRERDRSERLEGAVAREQALHAATLYLQERHAQSRPESSLVSVSPPAAVPTRRVRRFRRLAAELIVLALLGIAAWASFYALHLW